jgi:hypothetical protein
MQNAELSLYQLWRRALPERAPIAKWSGYKTGIVVRHISSLLFLYLDITPAVGTVVKKRG